LTNTPSYFNPIGEINLTLQWASQQARRFGGEDCDLHVHVETINYCTKHRLAELKAAMAVAFIDLLPIFLHCRRLEPEIQISSHRD